MTCSRMPRLAVSGAVGPSLGAPTEHSDAPSGLGHHLPIPKEPKTVPSGHPATALRVPLSGESCPTQRKWNGDRMSDTSLLVKSASEKIESAIIRLRCRYPKFQQRNTINSRSSVLYVLASNMTFVHFSWDVRDKYRISFGPLDADGEIPESIYSPLLNQFRTRYSTDIVADMRNAVVPYTLEWRSDVLKATDAFMDNAKVLLEGDWSRRIELERVIRPNFKMNH